jgi:hypothetical protein
MHGTTCSHRKTANAQVEGEVATAPVELDGTVLLTVRGASSLAGGRACTSHRKSD